MDAAWDLWPENAVAYRAFSELSSGRDWVSGGMGAAFPRPISFAEKHAYAKAHGLGRTRTAMETWLTLLAVQDEEYLNWYTERTERTHG